MDELANRVNKMCFRTPRYQIKHLVKNPERLPVTVEFELSNDEEELYEKLMQYLHKPIKYAYPKMKEYRLTLNTLRVFSSSTFALTGFLKGAFARLNVQLKNTENPQIKAEFRQVDELLKLSQSIQTNAK